MTRQIVVVLLAVGACSKHPDTAQCEKARDQFLANYAERINKAIEEDDQAHKDKDRKDADVELATGKVKFVDVCKATSEFKFDCFDSIAKEDSADCKTFTKDLSHKVLH